MVAAWRCSNTPLGHLICHELRRREEEGAEKGDRKQVTQSPRPLLCGRGGGERRILRSSLQAQPRAAAGGKVHSLIL